MKKLLLLITVIGAAFFTSCDKEPEEMPEEELSNALAGTTWEGVRFYYPNPGTPGKMELDMAFTSTTVDFSCSDYPYEGDETTWSFTGTYTYVPPTVTITVTSPEHLKGLINTGTVDDKNMEIRIHLTTDQIDRYLLGLP